MSARSFLRRGERRFDLFGEGSLAGDSGFLPLFPFIPILFFFPQPPVAPPPPAVESNGARLDLHMDLHVRESRSASAVMAQHAAVQLAQGAQGKSQGSAVSGQGSSQTNAKSYPTSFVLPFLHFAFGNGEPVVLPLDDIDNNMGPTDFAEFWNATAVVLPGETVSLPTLSYKYDQGKANLGQVTLLLNGTITRSRSGYLFFRGDVTGLASSYSFEARKAGDRQGSNEEWVSAGRWMRDNLGSQEFPVVYDGRRQVFFRGWQQ